jgi:hypothetical protein
MTICSCVLPAHCCQPGVVGGVIYADLRGELKTHLAQQVLFTQSSPVHEPLLQAFPFPSTLGRWHCTHFLRPGCLFTAHVGSGSSPLSCGVFLHHHFYKFFCSWLLGGAAAPATCRVCLQLTWEAGLPPLLWVFLPKPLSQAFLLLVAGRTPRLLPKSLCLAGLFIYSSRKDSLPPLFGAQCTPHSFPRVFIVFIAYYSVSIFSPSGGWSVQGLCWSGPGLSVGVLWYH